MLENRIELKDKDVKMNALECMKLSIVEYGLRQKQI
jgi:hypothetical protein